MEKDLIKALQVIASYKLWGEKLEGEELTIAREADEYDDDQDCYNPCIDTESSMLQSAVELAREALTKLGIPHSESADNKTSFTEYRNAVDAVMLKFFGISTGDAGIEAYHIARAQEEGQAPEDFALWFGEKYGLTQVREW